MVMVMVMVMVVVVMVMVTVVVMVMVTVVVVVVVTVARGGEVSCGKDNDSGVLTYFKILKLINALAICVYFTSSGSETEVKSRRQRVDFVRLMKDGRKMIFAIYAP